MRKKSKFIVSILCIALFIALFLYGIQQTTSKAADYGISNPRVVEGGNVTWNCIYFGNYWQNDTNGDGVADQNDEKEAIKWRVLKINGDDAFLLADQCLDAKPYNNVDEGIKWEDSPLRKWIINDFYNTAFTNSEKDSIIQTDWLNEDGDSVKDKISILSYTESCNAGYGFNINYRIESETREAKNTEYAKANKASTHYSGNGSWWLRSYDSLLGNFYSIGSDGCIIRLSGWALNENKRTVRPCIHLDLSSDIWSKADTVTATGGTFPIPTPTPIPTYPNIIVPSSPIKPTPTVTPTPTPSPRTVTAPSRPTKVKAKNKKKKSVTLSWKKVKRATGYQVQYATNEAFSRKSKTTKKTKIVFKKLKKKRTYSFRVRAYVLNNKKKIYSKWSKVRRIKIKK